MPSGNCLSSHMFNMLDVLACRVQPLHHGGQPHNLVVIATSADRKKDKHLLPCIPYNSKCIGIAHPTDVALNQIITRMHLQQQFGRCHYFHQWRAVSGLDVGPEWKNCWVIRPLISELHRAIEKLSSTETKIAVMGGCRILIDGWMKRGNVMPRGEEVN